MHLKLQRNNLDNKTIQFKSMLEVEKYQRYQKKTKKTKHP